jgi:hypothetical protein
MLMIYQASLIFILIYFNIIKRRFHAILVWNLMFLLICNRWNTPVTLILKFFFDISNDNILLNLLVIIMHIEMIRNKYKQILE